MSKQSRKLAFINGLLADMNQGAVSVPYLLIKYYPELKLSDMEAMLLIHIISFKEKEQKDFPTIEELQVRMSADPDDVINTLQKLIKQQFLTIDEEIDQQSGIQYEKYNLRLTFEKLAQCYADELEAHAMQQDSSKSEESKPESETNKNIYTIFEKEYARPLSPMEYETITGWLDYDKYGEELILAALKEAVFAGKLHFRYIDRILIDWRRNRIRTAEQAKEYTQNFRGN